MNIDDLKAAEDKRRSEQETEQQTVNQIKELLIEENALWKQAEPLYRNRKKTLMKEFIEIFKSKNFTPQQRSTNYVEMLYNGKSFTFDNYKDCPVTFNILNEFETPSCGYSFTVEHADLNLHRSSFANLYNDKVQSINEHNPQEDVENLSNYVSNLRVKISDLNNWKLMIAPFDKTEDLLGKVKYNNIQEVINAILNRKR